MTTTRLGVLALALLGINLIVQGSLGWALILATSPSVGDLLLILPYVVAGVALVRWRVPLSTMLFGADDTEIGTMSVWDVQVVGLATLGVWVVAENLPGLISGAVALSPWGPPSSAMSLVALSPAAFGTVLGGALVLKCRILARLWCPAPALPDSSSEGAA